MQKVTAFFFILFLHSITAISLDAYMFRLQLKDKGKSSYTIDNPEQFLSKRALERRQRQNIVIDSSDLPISREYIEIINKLDFKVISESKWMTTLTVHCTDSALIDTIKNLDFVNNITFVWKSDTNDIYKKRNPIAKKVKFSNKSLTEYGYAYDQIKTLNGTYLHEKGYKGKGIEIAVIDAGYRNLNNILLLDNVVVEGIKDFVYKGEDILEGSDHGIKVLSVMATNRPNVFVGTAPESKYWLLRSEDNRSEFPVEEDYWVAAAEYADSVGVDIINTSLGYSNFNFPSEIYYQDQLDGNMYFISRAAEIATQKGIFVEVSAGNEGNKKWQKIVAPADAMHVLTVGSITRDSLVSRFSSRGPTNDNRIKPDVVALGSKIDIINSAGEVEQSNGTSFAGPVISGLAACLWEAYPNLTNYQLLEIIKECAHRYCDPDTSFGYGIPNMEKAFDLANKRSSDNIIILKKPEIEITEL